jgi:hypothetical protein
MGVTALNYIRLECNSISLIFVKGYETYWGFGILFMCEVLQGVFCVYRLAYSVEFLVKLTLKE